MAKEIQDILTNDVINSTITNLSKKLGTTVDSLVQEFAMYFIGIHIFWLCVGLFLFIIGLIGIIYSYKYFCNDDRTGYHDDTMVWVLGISIFDMPPAIIVVLYNIYMLVCIYCAPTITLIKYVMDMMKD